MVIPHSLGGLQTDLEGRPARKHDMCVHNLSGSKQRPVTWPLKIPATHGLTIALEMISCVLREDLRVSNGVPCMFIAPSLENVVSHSIARRQKIRFLVMSS